MKATEVKLYRYTEYKRRIEELEKQIIEILDKKDAIADRMLRGVNLEQLRVKGGFNPDPVFEAVQKMVDVYGERINAIRNELIGLYYLINEITSAVNNAGLTEPERQYIQYRYFDRLRASQTAAKMGYSENHSQRIKNRALIKLARYMSDNA